MKKAIIIFVSIFFIILLLNATTDNTKARELINQGYETFQIYKNPSKAFLYFKQAIELASGYIKSTALIRAAYMSYLLGNEVSNFQNFIIDALDIDPEMKLNAIDFQPSFIEIVNDIQSRGENTVTPIIAKPAPEPVTVNANPVATKTTPESTSAQQKIDKKEDIEVRPATNKPVLESTTTQSKSVEEKGAEVKQAITNKTQKLTAKAKRYALGLKTDIPALGFEQSNAISLRFPNGLEFDVKIIFIKEDDMKSIGLGFFGYYIFPIFHGKSERELLNAVLGGGIALASTGGGGSTAWGGQIFGGFEIPIKLTSNTKISLRTGLQADILKGYFKISIQKNIGFYWYF